MEPIISLTSSWQKMEFERWPTLLDEVQDQYELNARKVGIVIKKNLVMNKNTVESNTYFFLLQLWLPLFSVLFQKDNVEISEHENESISQRCAPDEYCGAYICILARIRLSKR